MKAFESGDMITVKGVENCDFVSRAKGWITYIDPNGVVKRCRPKDITVIRLPKAKAEKEETKMATTKRKAKKRTSTKGPTKKAPAKRTAKKQAAKKQAAKAENGDARTNKIVKASYDPSRYVRGLGETASGNSTYDINDDVAQVLRGKTLDQQYEETARLIKKAGLEEGTMANIAKALRKRYSKLNPGMQRMNLGNRARRASRVIAEA